jgi:hypothetical protein
MIRSASFLFVLLSQQATRKTNGLHFIFSLAAYN